MYHPSALYTNATYSLFKYNLPAISFANEYCIQIRQKIIGLQQPQYCQMIHADKINPQIYNFFNDYDRNSVKPDE